MKRRIGIGIGIALFTAVSAWAASEITANFTLQVIKGNLNIQRTTAGQITLTASDPSVAGLTQSINTNNVGTALTLGDVSTNGVAWFRNMNTNTAYYVEIGRQDSLTNFLPLVRLNANEAWPFRISQGITPYARANGASVILEKLIFDN